MQGFEGPFVENFSHEALPPDPEKFPVFIHGCYTAPFLSSVLKGLETEISDLGGILHSEHSEYAAFFVELVIVHFYHSGVVCWKCKINLF